MRIKTRFELTLLVFGAVLAAALALIIITDREAEKVEVQAEVAAGIAQGASELIYLSTDYLIYGEDQHLERWQSSFASFKGRIEKLDVDKPEEQMLVANLRENSRRLKNTFDNVLSAAVIIPRNQNMNLKLEFLQRSSSRMAVQTQGLFSDAHRLYRLMQARVNYLKKTRTLFVYILLGLLGLFLLANYMLTYRRTMKSMALLQTGAKNIGSGNLDFKIKKERDDEIGELADAFNQMTTDLKTVTASKTELESEIDKRKRVEDVLQTTLQRFHTLLSSSYSGILFSAEDGRVEFVNQAFCDLYEFEETPAELVGLTSQQVIDKVKIGYDHPEAAIVRINEILQQGQPVRGEEVVIKGKTVLRDFIPLQVGGKPCGRLWHYTDITYRKKAEEALRSKQAEIQALFDNTPAGLVLFDARSPYTVIAHNRYYQELFAEPFRSCGMVGLNVYEYAPAVDASGVVAVFDEVVLSKQPRSFLDFPYKSNQLKESWFNWHMSPIIIDGQVAALVSMSIDVTKRHEMEVALRESEERLRFALETSQTGAWELDLTGKTAHRSPEHDRIFGYAQLLPQWTYEMFLSHVLPEDRAAVDAKFRQATTTQTDWNFECRIRRTDGEIRWIWAAGRQRLDGGGSAHRMAGIVQDITERKQMEEQLRKSRDELEIRVAERTAELTISNRALTEYTVKLEKLNQELQEFTFIASHDLQEPLRKIQTFCDLVQKRYTPALDQAGQDYLDRLAGFAGRMRQLLNDLLQFSKITSRQEPVKKVDLGKIVREAAELFEEDVKKSGGHIQIESKSIPEVDADEMQMLSLFQNLIGNAFKYRGKENPQIRIYAKDAGSGMCEIFVEDNGIGFDPQFAELIFKPFQRVHGRKEYEGTGMGLAICRKIIERHDGSIRADSEPGKGSTFIIRMPLKQENRKGI